jgi:bifunctional non-homologous end joining protein LigD
MKSKKRAASPVEIVAARAKSVLTGRTTERVAEDHDRVWHSKRTPVEELVSQLPTDLPFTNLDKVLFPEQGITKGRLVAYFAVVSEQLLAQAGGRPLTLVRCPEGRHKKCFFQKHATPGTPPSLRRVPIREEDGTVAEYLHVDDLRGVVALAQLGVLEIHTWGCHADEIEKPDQLVIDLDPDVAIEWDDVVAAALEIRRRLGDAGLESFVKTTGGKGLHVVAPVARRTSWDDFKGFARRIAEGAEGDAPDRYTTNSLKARRKGKLFVDYLRNARGASAIAAYSPRAREGAPVATPLTWDELEAGVRPSDFTIETVPRRLAKLRDDPWDGYDALRQAIRKKG